MFATIKQQQEVQQILQNNESLVWDGKYGFYSNGDVVISIFWDFDKSKEIFKITITN